MINSKAAFFLGVLPGVIFALSNIWRWLRHIRRVRAMAMAEGQDFDLNADVIRQWRLLRDSSILFVDGESPGLRKAKENLLSEYPAVMRRHMLAAVIVALGAFAGPFITLFL